MIKRTEITSFDKTEHTVCDSIRPEKYDDILKIRNRPVIARGAGLSYCNASASAEGIVVDMCRMDKILAFDPDKALVTVEAGIKIGELNNFLISNNFIFAVLPGYPSITVGGCIAFNVHGKSQFKVGTFGDWVKAMRIHHPAHGEISCSASENKDLFDLTIGGMGFTGIILTATLSVQKLAGEKLESERVIVKNIYEAVQVMKDSEQNYDYVYSWNNFNKRNTSFGEGVVYLEKFVPGKINIRPYKDKMELSYKLPSFHNNFTIKNMCSIFYFLEKLKGKKTQQDLMAGSFPIYNKEIYYYLFGKKGFREYQMLIPINKYEAAFGEIKNLIAEMNIAVSLGSLKLFNGTKHNLSFTGEGVCVTIDIQVSVKAEPFFKALDLICEKYQCIVNLSKDSRANHELARKLYSEFDNFKEKINAFDPKNYIVSDLKKRLELQS